MQHPERDITSWQTKIIKIIWSNYHILSDTLHCMQRMPKTNTQKSKIRHSVMKNTSKNTKQKRPKRFNTYMSQNNEVRNEYEQQLRDKINMIWNSNDDYKQKQKTLSTAITYITKNTIVRKIPVNNNYQ